MQWQVAGKLSSDSVEAMCCMYVKAGRVGEHTYITQTVARTKLKEAAGRVIVAAGNAWAWVWVGMKVGSR